jgi:hypothetical protein
MTATTTTPAMTKAPTGGGDVRRRAPMCSGTPVAYDEGNPA